MDETPEVIDFAETLERVCIETVESGKMTKDLALLIGPDQEFQTTQEFLASIDEGVPAHVLSAALFDRFESRGEADFANRLLSAMRKEFGGHDEQKPG